MHASAREDVERLVGALSEVLGGTKGVHVLERRSF
jgi:hypothetical protein